MAGRFVPGLHELVADIKSILEGNADPGLLNKWLAPIDNATRTNFFPYGFSGVMVGAALVFFAFIGFDSISTHAEEAIRPQRDVPFGILASLALCTILYFGVSAVITGMEPYPEIDEEAAVAVAFRRLAENVPGPGSCRARRVSLPHSRPGPAEMRQGSRLRTP